MTITAPKRLISGTPSRGTQDTGPGDFVKVGTEWKEVRSNTAFGVFPLPKSWTVTLTDGTELGMFHINRYAKKDDLEEM